MVEQVGNTLLQQDTVETLPDRLVEVVADLHLDPYYGDEDETEALYSSLAKRETTSFNAYATLYVLAPISGIRKFSAERQSSPRLHC